MKTTPGYIVCILIPFLILILLEGIRCISLFRKYKAEQKAELQAERDKIKAERLETQRMMKELQQMKAQMTQTAPKEPEKTDKHHGINTKSRDYILSLKNNTRR